MKNFKTSLSLFLSAVLMACMVITAVAEAGKVNINTDGKEILVTLKYVGDAIADRIIKYRKAHLFEKPEDIMNVKGVGVKTFAANKDRIIIK